MIRIGILEDEQRDAERLTSFLKKYAEEKQLSFSTTCFTNSTHFLEKYNSDFDLLFIDIELPDLNGMDAMHKLRLIDEKVMIIFVTNLAQYAVNGYEVGAFDFIIKPITFYNLTVKLNRALARLEHKKEKTIWINTRTDKKKIDINTLKYVEVNKHKLIYHTTNGNITTLGTMKEVVELLQNSQFSLCNQCYLVNLSFVTGIEGYDCVLGDERLKISAPKKKDFLHALNDFLAGGYIN